MTLSPGLRPPGWQGTVMLDPPASWTVAPAPSTACTLAGRKFIFGLPMKPATKMLRGWWYSSSGEPACSTMPAWSTTILSAMVMASTWSWVT